MPKLVMALRYNRMRLAGQRGKRSSDLGNVGLRINEQGAFPHENLGLDGYAGA